MAIITPNGNNDNELMTLYIHVMDFDRYKKNTHYVCNLTIILNIFVLMRAYKNTPIS